MPIRVIKSPPESQDAIRQGGSSTIQSIGDFLRAASQPVSYFREIGEGNFLPTQAELESRGVSPVDMAMALFNPFDHLYATGAEMDLFNDPNYGSSSRDPRLDYATMGPVASMLLGSTANRAQRIARAPKLQKAANILKGYGIKGLDAISPGTLRRVKESAKGALPADLSDALDVFADLDSKAYQIGDDIHSAMPDSDFRIPSDQTFSPYAFSEWLKSNNPKLILDYQAGSQNSPEMSRAFKDFSDQLLTSYRGVGVPIDDINKARDAVVNPRGTSHHIYGEGRYSSPSLDMASGYGSKGSVARVKSGDFPINSKTSDMAYGLDNMYREGTAFGAKSRPGDYIYMKDAAGNRLYGQDNLDALALAAKNDMTSRMNIDMVPYRYGLRDEQMVRVTRTPTQPMRSSMDFKLEDIVGTQDATSLARPTLFNEDAIRGSRISKGNKGSGLRGDGSVALQDYTEGAYFRPSEQLAGGLGLVSLEDLQKLGYTIPTKYLQGGRIKPIKKYPMKVMKK